MTSTEAELRAEAANIKSSLSSLACSNVTLASLQTLLGAGPKPSLNDTNSKENVRPNAPKPLPSGRGTATSRTKTKAKPGASAQAKQDEKHELPAQERVLLATEVVNTSLKALSAALKPQPKRHRVSSSLSNQATHSRRSSVASITTSSRPLMSRAVSQITNTSVISVRSSSLRRSSSYSSIKLGPGPNVIAAAECARLGFAYLRSSEAWNISGKKMPALQLETGMLALVGKLLAHGLDNLAVKELRVLKKRLGMYMQKSKVEKESESQTATGNKASAPEDTLAALLSFDDIDLQSPALQLVVNHQLYVLRVIANTKKPSVVEAANAYLQHSPSSPLVILSELAKKPTIKEKAARQLESFAQIMLSICPSIASSSDSLACSGKVSASPDTILQLQRLAFEFRVTWWKLSGHAADVNKELLEPFAKCLTAFSRRSQSPANTKYLVAAECVESVDALLGSLSEKIRAFETTTARSNMYRVLSTMAQFAGADEEALAWTKKLTSTAGDSHGFGARSAASAVRLAALKLDQRNSGKSDEHIAGIIQTALDGLNGNLKGDSSDLDLLLSEVSGLRKAATKPFTSSGRASGTSEDTAKHQLDALCFSALSACAHFLARYIGTGPMEGSDSKSLLRRGERLVLASRIAKGFVDSAVLCCKVTILAGRAEWESLDEFLQDCLFVLREVEITLKAQGRPTSDLPFVKLSGVYWLHYIQLRKSDVTDTQLLQPLRRSIDIIIDRDEKDQVSGLLLVKLEKLGEALESMRRYADSRDTFLRSLKIQISTNALKRFAEQAARTPLNQLITQECQVATLARTLRSLHKLFLRASAEKDCDRVYYDDGELEPQQRAALLEFQLMLCCASAAKTHHRRPALDLSVRDLVNILFELYSSEEYPLRRQRLSIMVLRFAGDTEDVLSPEIIELATRSAVLPGVSLGLDTGLAQYLTHLSASHTTCIALNDSPISIEKLKSALQSWQSVVDSLQSELSISAQIDNFETWITQLQMISDFFHVQGLHFLRVPALYLLIKAAESQQPTDFDTLVSTLSALGLQYLHLGYSGHAGLTLAKAQGIINSNNLSIETILQWHLSYAEYTLAIGNSERCLETLATAQDLAASSPAIADMSKSTASLSSRIRYNQLLADASYVHSLVSLDIGKANEALEYARRCVNVNKRIWASLENRNPLRASGASSEVNDSEIEGLAGGVSKISIASKSSPVIMSMTHESLGGAAFWSFVPSLFRGLTQMSNVFAHEGMFQESIYFADQAAKVAAAVNSNAFIVQNLSFTSRCYIQGSRSEKALEYLDKAQPLIKMLDGNVEKALYHQSRAELQSFLNEDGEALLEYDQAQAVISQLMEPSFAQSLEKLPILDGDLVEKMSEMKLTAATTKPRARKAPVQTAAKTTKTRKAPAKPAAKTSTRKTATSKTAPAVKSSSEEYPVLSNMRGDILRSKAGVLLQREKLTEAIALINEAEAMKLGLTSSVQHQSTRFRSLMLEAMKEMAGDFTFNTLPESTLSFPALSRAERKPSEPAGARPSYLLSSPPAPAPARKVGRGKKASAEDFVAVLQKARECISEVQRQAIQTSSTSTVQRVCGMLNEVTILLSAAVPKGAKGSLHPLYAAYLTELPKSNAIRLEHAALTIEHKAVTRDELQAWPSLSSTQDGEVMTAADFQNEYINIIPENWTAISLSLNEARDELYITRYHANQSPFILRLPMSRHNSRDMDEEIFGFDEGKAELHEIISLSDFSTQSPPDTTKKGAKTEWWAAREELDARLKDLLVNIESVWLGGFRGVFAAKKGDKTLLARFQKSFQNVLDRHLPSRQGKGKKTKPPQLDSRILELFVGLGNPDDGSADLDEQLMDLVYFVVDILQFNGERNAYDEIDFDSIIIEMLDALRAYHTATETISTTPQHTILILDRNLHAFPWESLPSLQHLSISRLPSMTALRDRLLAARCPRVSPDTETSEYAGHHIPRSSLNGASILNPAGDLANTQAMLCPHLDAMPGSWDRTASKAPTEKQFESNIRDKDVLLYFGHGSGAQYIRGRAVKRLYTATHSNDNEGQKKNLATTLLFGCSSAHVTENGEFEPSGMLYSYVTAGVPAVLGMLWDVTDKDCDRFAVSTLQHWGLFEKEHVKEEVVAPKTPSKTPSKSRGRTPSKGRSRSRVRKDDGDVGTGVGSEGRPVGLDEAVMRSRDKCYLRYLNGAAGVVYGIPVFLDGE
ncbi:hypothetical protein K490DRAFT_37691 [Saccharata proteae CBS 121410]|uniref:separase n=1 Tax=Saccharata proteae CBS 121410 TaxID=1314787 RepID=A0A6A5YBM6_9PEZI|nr:hypothetical protein K490DRAFT_37691 [Saccharata proteae CBS 121410]